MSRQPAVTNYRKRRARRIAIGAAVVVAVAGMNGPALWRFGAEKYHDYEINQPEYKADKGHWSFLDIPSEYQVNGVHAAVLHTGKVLLIAGSGNNQKNFDAKKFETVLWDPKTEDFKHIPTPKDLFCSGHTQLPDGKLLVAGGTKRYEKLQGDVTKAGGLMIVHNEDPDEPKTLPAGTKFTSKKSGKTFVSMDSLLVEKAKKVFDPKTGKVLRTESGRGRVYVEAEKAGKKFETGAQENFRVQGLTGADARNVYGMAQKLALDKKDFQGIKDTYEFDPVAEKYIPVDPMNEARWYPTLATLEDGKVLAVSGLNDIGELVPGKNEIFDPATKKWEYAKKLRKFPTYPSLFLMDNGKLFFTGSNSGYGLADEGREPGIWDVETDAFQKVPGMSDPDQLETSASVMLPPAQDQRFMVIGGGGIGESEESSEKSRLIDLKEPKPRFKDGATLEKGTRYPSASLLPDDSVLVTGGSEDYRGRGGTNILQARTYDPSSGTYKRVADPNVGRNYHSGSVLLPDGRVMIFGSDSLYGDKANTKPGVFEQRIEIYKPAYLFADSRPEVTGGPKRIARGGTGTFEVTSEKPLKTAKLMRPSAVTHVTDVDQRTIALKTTRTEGGIEVTVPTNRALVPAGWYMLFVTDDQGTPSEAVWVEVP
ncbi:galactose oxidase-like domain-containing protein [Streptomyces sp. NBC_00690]|uniref:galactose oxidase-like domain-containing protein n=1 Tax=Streptomyces sp. NBC_00690 TaxID=2975808 RepID=UPI002E2BAB00|nr:galactose oxidase-like domain-containing protein [Streptomyces sp. NBC_00690]